MANRKRDNRLYFCATDEEYEKIKEKIAKSGRSQQDFLLKAALNKKIVVIPREEFTRIALELTRQGNNLNQIAKACNSGSQEESKILEMAEEMENLWQQLNALILKQV